MAVCAAALCLGSSIGAQAEEKLTVTSWGGSYSESQRKAFFEPFAEATGHTVLEDEWNGDLAKVRAMVETGNYQTHVIDAESSQLVAGCDEGLWEKIDYGKLGFGPDDFLAGAAHECGVGNISWSFIFAYDKDQITGDGPQNWADFWDVEAFPGMRGLRKQPKWNLEYALIADGVSPNEVYDVLGTEEGLNRAFAKLDELKPHVIWYEASAQAPQLLADGEVVMTSAANGRIFTAITQDGKNFEIVWDSQAMDFDFWVIPSGHPQVDLAHEFIQFASDPERMGEQTQYVSYGPLRKAAVEFVDPDILPHLPTAPANTERWFKTDTQFWADNREALVERFNVWVAQ
jgi:putative spermidine/putrescine transport system substrate-binding protein